MDEPKKTLPKSQPGRQTEAIRFMDDLQKNRDLRVEALRAPRQQILKVAQAHGYKLTDKELYDAMRDQGANDSVPHSSDVDEEDDPDTCCCCTFSESPEL
jgi:hypothetical protein